MVEKKAEKEIISKAKKLKDEAFNRKNYEDIVGLVAKKYSSLKEVESKDVSQFVSNLNGAWKDLSKKLKKDIIVLK
jgi:coenzyme F420-reducing hydrogenase alpha subunit